MLTLKLKTQPTFFAAVKQISRLLLKEREVFGSMGSNSHVCTLLFTDFNLLCQFLYFCGQSIVMIDAVKHQLLVALRVCMFSNFTYGFSSELKDWKAMPPKKRDYSCRLSQSSNLCGALSTRNLSSIFATLSKALVSYYKDDQTFSFNIALEDVLPSVKPHVSTLHKLDNRFTEETVTSTVLRNNASLRYSLPISLAWINICFKAVPTFVTAQSYVLRISRYSGGAL